MKERTQCNAHFQVLYSDNGGAYKKKFKLNKIINQTIYSNTVHQNRACERELTFVISCSNY